MVAAFDKAVNLVRRIENQNNDRNEAEAIQDLSKSLSLGPVIVLGYFDADSKRFGPAYLYGDYQAQVELRDVLLGLKNLVGDLQDVLLDGNQIDFGQLQETSDACRSNAGVCLAQLSQKLAQARSDPMAMQFQNPPPQYMSGVPSSGSTGLQNSSSRSTHSSSRGRMLGTPDSSTQQRIVIPKWQPKRSGSSEHTFPHHRRPSTDPSLQENCGNWSQTSQLFAERDTDELSVRRPSSHTLSPEDGALLSSIRLHEGARAAQKIYDPDDEDRAGDWNGGMSPRVKLRSPAERSNNSLGGARERYGPDDCLPVHSEQHDLFLIDRSSTQSVTSYAFRASSGHLSTVEHVSSDYRHSAEPQALRLPKRKAQQPVRQASGPPSSPPRKPIPPIPCESLNGHAPIARHTDVSVRMTPCTHGQKVPVPPRHHSRPTLDAGIPRRTLSPQPQVPPSQPSPQVQRAMQSGQSCRQYNADRSPQFTTEASSQSHSDTQLLTSSIIPSPTSPTVFSQSLYPDTLQRHIIQSPQRLQQFASKSSQSLLIAQREVQFPTQAVKAPSITLSATHIPQNMPLTLPTDKNTHPFCKGAFRLFLGLTKKAFIPANRPVGMSSLIPYWRCDKCLFEGPMREAPGPVDKKGRPGKPEKIFDPTTRECGPISTAVIGPDGRGEGSGGVRYKWIFLAKCHVPLKNVPDKSDGSVGGYACIFCCAEGSARGWTTSAGGSLGPGMNGPGLNDTASTVSGKSRHSSNAATGSNPVFANLPLFMDHLQMHRREENWPCPEMLGRMKCIVGRIADGNEEWEVNFLPL